MRKGRRWGRLRQKTKLIINLVLDVEILPRAFRLLPRSCEKCYRIWRLEAFFSSPLAQPLFSCRDDDNDVPWISLKILFCVAISFIIAMNIFSLACSCVCVCVEGKLRSTSATIDWLMMSRRIKQPWMTTERKRISRSRTARGSTTLLSTTTSPIHATPRTSRTMWFHVSRATRKSYFPQLSKKFLVGNLCSSHMKKKLQWVRKATTWDFCGASARLHFVRRVSSCWRVAC